jgi:hypothetical protein
VLPGVLLIGWIVVEAFLLEESSLLEPPYAAVGAATDAAGHRWLRNALRGDRWTTQRAGR